jgi:hypothetical protein
MKIEIPFSGSICLDVKDFEEAINAEKPVIEAMRWAKKVSDEVGKDEESKKIFFVKILIDYNHTYVLTIGSEENEKAKALSEQVANIKPFAKKVLK